jgi:23S rRNA pseudouridine1911/1915/1917 synthase
MKIKIEENQSNQRLDNFLSQELPNKSRSQIQKLIQSELILINNNPVKKNYNLQPNDEIQILPEPETQNPLQPIKKPLNIIFQNQDLLVIDKPANLSVHQDIQGHQKETLINWLLGNQIQLSSIGGIHRPGIVHRLDKDTSGALIIAKNDQTHHFLQKQFADRKVDKTYLTLVDGILPTKTGTINSPITRDQVDRKKMKVSASPKARPSITHFKVLETYHLPPHTKSDKRCSLLEVKIETGRTHQIRVHMASIGHPVIGDDKYGSSKINQTFQTLGLKRQFLHAHKLKLHINKKEEKLFTSPLPPDLQSVVDKLN